MLDVFYTSNHLAGVNKTVLYYSVSLVDSLGEALKALGHPLCLVS